MPRIRTIKPEFFEDEKLFDAEIEENLPLRVAYAGLWTEADREGRFEYRARKLKKNVLPYDDVDFSRVLDALITRGFIVKYEVDGRVFCAIRSWHRHQVVNNRERESDIPEPPINQGVTPENDAQPTREPRDDDACHKERKGREGKGKEQIDALFEELKKIYPSRSPHQNPMKPAMESLKRKIKAGFPPEKILDGARRYAEQVKTAKTSPEHVAQMVTFLNQERFNDEMDEATRGPKF